MAAADTSDYGHPPPAAAFLLTFEHAVGFSFGLVSVRIMTLSIRYISRVKILQKFVSIFLPPLLEDFVEFLNIAKPYFWPQFPFLASIFLPPDFKDLVQI